MKKTIINMLELELLVQNQEYNTDKLQLILYFTQHWHLKLHFSSIIPSYFTRTKTGPVISLENFQEIEITDTVKYLIEDVVYIYGKQTTEELLELFNSLQFSAKNGQEITDKENFNQTVKQ